MSGCGARARPCSLVEHGQAPFGFLVVLLGVFVPLWLLIPRLPSSPTEPPPTPDGGQSGPAPPPRCGEPAPGLAACVLHLCPPKCGHCWPVVLFSRCGRVLASLARRGGGFAANSPSPCAFQEPKVVLKALRFANAPQPGSSNRACADPARTDPASNPRPPGRRRPPAGATARPGIPPAGRRRVPPARPPNSPA